MNLIRKMTRPRIFLIFFFFVGFSVFGVLPTFSSTGTPLGTSTEVHEMASRSRSGVYRLEPAAHLYHRYRDDLRNHSDGCVCFESAVFCVSADRLYVAGDGESRLYIYHADGGIGTCGSDGYDFQVDSDRHG